MGALGDQERLCQRCGKISATVRERGRIDLMARLCELCWNILANEMAEADGATATPRPEPDLDDVSWIEPPACPRCGAAIRVYPTNYDRWVSLATVELPAKDVPEAFRWRLTKLPGDPPSSPISWPYGSVESIRYPASPSYRLTTSCAYPTMVSPDQHTGRESVPCPPRARSSSTQRGATGNVGAWPEDAQVSVSPDQLRSAYAIFQTSYAGSISVARSRRPEGPGSRAAGPFGISRAPLPPLP
ncbi:DUF6083 domain-containing protein [Streptomyces xanthochromogenes]|uniref:DUF6083 domain-containing protein n=1 Tax=Streptomyces xanthochromogenes TaxID=67384 RepID=UPI002F3E3443